MADHGDIDQRPLPGALFSMDAADNAEVIPTDLPGGLGSMWSTTATPDDVVQVEADGGPGHDVLDEDAAWAQMGSSMPPGASEGQRPPLFSSNGFGVGRPGDPSDHVEVPPTAACAPGAGGVFSAEPVAYDEVLDEGEVDGELEDDDGWSDRGPSSSVFSSGTAVGGADPGGVRPGAPTAATNAAPKGASPFAAPDDPWSAWQDQEREPPPSRSTPPPFTTPEAHAVPTPPVAEVPRERHDADPAAAVAADQHGLDVAVSRLRPDDQERARVPLSVCGALLAPGEQVLGAVTGQMLGRPAAVVVTRTRVLVVNDRRWQPIVDIYPIDERLQVRGRHDRQVAALSFADDQRLSMVDGITEVDIAIDLAEAIRDPGLSDRGSGAAF